MIDAMYMIKNQWRKWEGTTESLLDELDNYIGSYTNFMSKTYPYLLRMNKRMAYNSFLSKTKGYKKAKEVRDKINDKLKSH